MIISTMRISATRLSVDTRKELHITHFGIYVLLAFWLRGLYGLLLTISYPAMVWHVDVVAVYCHRRGSDPKCRAM